MLVIECVTSRALPPVAIHNRGGNRPPPATVTEPTSKYRESDREQMKPMLSNGSRGALMSYTDHSVQRRFKSNTPTDWISQHCLVFT